MVTDVKIRWEGTTLIVKGTDGEEMRFENAYVKDPRYDYVEPESKPAWKSQVKVSDITNELDKLWGRKTSD